MAAYFFLRLPIGLQTPIPLQNKQSKKKAKGTKTITVFADFDNPWKGRIAQEIQRIKSITWAPSEDDFSVVSKGGVKISHYMQLLGPIVQAPKGSIARVNVVTHANPSLIAFHGTLKPKSTFTEVSMTIAGSINDQEIQKWPTASFILQGGAKTSDGKTNFTLKDVRDRFAKDAEIIFYACHSGVDTKFLSDISKALGAKARGFSKRIAYCPTSQTNPPSIDRRWLAIGNCQGTKHMDLKSLNPDRP